MTTRQNCVSEKSGRLFYLGFTSDTLNKTSMEEEKRRREDDTKPERRAREEEDEYSRALFCWRTKVSLFLSSSSKSSSAYYKGKIYDE